MLGEAVIKCNAMYKVVKKTESILGFEYPGDHSLDDLIAEKEIQECLVYSKEVIEIYDHVSGELLHTKETVGRYQ